MSSQIIWWEKTVEYAFVRDHMQDLANAIPLDGNQEQWWGDLITEEGGEFTLIEFKRNHLAISDEFDKYPGRCDYQGTVRNHVPLVMSQKPNLLLMAGAKAHVFVLGAEDEETLTMKLQRGLYWDATRKLEDIQKGEQLPKTDGKSFAEYTLELRKIRQSESQSTSSGGVVCASRKGKVIAAIDLQSFQKVTLELKQRLAIGHTQDFSVEKKHSSSSPGSP